MKFESIRGNFQRFLDLMHAHGGPDGMIQNGIPWDKVVGGVHTTMRMSISNSADKKTKKAKPTSS